MLDTLKIKLKELGLTDEQIPLLEKEGVNSEADMALLSADQIKAIAGCGVVTSIKIRVAFIPASTVPPPDTSGAPADPNAEIPDDKKPSPAQVNSFASALGMDSGMLTMMLMGGMVGNSGMGSGMDLSGMIPVPQIVAGYNAKVRNMFLLIMDQLESRLGAPVVVINQDGSVNRELTVEYITGLEEGREAAENNIYFDKAGDPYEVIRVGVDAQSIYDADPLDSTRALQVSGMGIGRVKWNDVSLEVRQVAYYAASRTHEIDPSDDGKLSWLRDHVKPGSTRLVFSGMAPKAISEFNEARRTGSLPTLRVMLTRGPRKVEIMPRRRSGSPRDMRTIAGIGSGASDS